MSALARMLLNTGLWDHSPKSLDCWLGAWLFVPEENVKTVSKVFVQAVKEADAGCLLDRMFALAGKQDAYLSDVLLHLGCVETLSSGYEFLLDFGALRKNLKSSLINNKLERQVILSLSNGDTAQVENSELTVFALDRVFAFALHFVKYWISQKKFSATDQLTSRLCLAAVFNAVPLTSRGPGKNILSTDPTARTLFNKCVSQLFGDELLIKQFRIDEEDLFTVWLKNVIVCLELHVEGEYLEEFRKRMLAQIGGVIDGEKEFVSGDLPFWMGFLRPAVEDLVPIFKKLCEKSDADVRCGAVWVAALRVVGFEPITKTFAAGLIAHLARMVVLPDVPREYCEALLELVTNQTLLVLMIPKGNFSWYHLLRFSVVVFAHLMNSCNFFKIIFSVIF